MSIEKPSMEDCLKEFHSKYGHFISTIPNIEIPENVKWLRYNLVDEEVGETLAGMGFIKKLNGTVEFNPVSQDLTEIADGIADSIYVLIGTAVSYGIPIERIFQEVHRSNMTKTAIKAEDGAKYGTKTPKGPDYIAPDVEGILNRPSTMTKLEMLFGD